MSNNLDIKYYRDFNKDLNRYNDNYLIKYFEKYGNLEKRIYNETTFYQFYPEFNDELIKKNNIELSCYDIYNLQVYYHNNKNIINNIYMDNFNLIFKKTYEDWNIYTISLENSLNYFKNYDLNILNKLNVHKRNDTNHMNLYTMEITNAITYNSIINNHHKLYDLFDNKEYDIFDIKLLQHPMSPIIIYYCNINNPFFIVQLSSYMDFFYIGYFKQKKIIEISYSTAGHEWYLSSVLHALKSPFKIDNNLNIYNRKYLYICFNSNVGHHLWNEISGLYYYLLNPEIHNKLEGILIGPYDFFNLKKILSEKYNLKIAIYQNYYDYNICNLNYSIDIFPCFLNNYYIDNTNIKNIFNINDTEKNKSTIEITIDIRTNRRILINQEIFYKNLINELINDFKDYNLKINFCGRFENNCFKINKNNDYEYIEQINIINKIINNINKNNKIIIKNLIGFDIIDIFNEIFNSNICIFTAGTCSSNLLNWIFNKKVITIGPLEIYNWKYAQYNVLQNYELSFIPPECITESSGLQGTFNMDFNKSYQFIKDEIIKTL